MVLLLKFQVEVFAGSLHCGVFLGKPLYSRFVSFHWEPLDANILRIII